MALAVAWLPGMHSDVLPETSPVTVTIQTEAPGLSAPETESLVMMPMEKNLLEGVMGVTDVTSDSIPGLSQVQLRFAPGTDLYQARQLVQERLTQAFVLPNVSKPPVPVAAGVITAFSLGTSGSLAAMAGLLGVIAIALHQAFRVTAAIRRAHLADGAQLGNGGRLTPGVVAAAAAGAGGPAVTAAAVAAVALLPFIVTGATAGNELLHTAAAVVLAGLVTATLVNTLVLPAACLRFGPVRGPERPEGPEDAEGPEQDQDLTGPSSVPPPEEPPPQAPQAPHAPEEPVIPVVPGVPQPTGQAESPVG